MDFKSIAYTYSATSALIMEQGARIELALSAWKAEILPLNEPRINLVEAGGIEPL